jgi:hypothetical protein
MQTMWGMLGARYHVIWALANAAKTWNIRVCEEAAMYSPGLYLQLLYLSFGDGSSWT